jgi:hypothetical protein
MGYPAIMADEAPPPERPAAAPVAAAERRSGDRSKLSVYRSALICWDRFETLCLVRNLSAGGMMCRLHVPLPPGQRVWIEMRCGADLAGTVVWCRDGHVGVQFRAPIDVAALLRAEAGGSAGDRIQRSPRLQLSCAAWVSLGGMRREVRMLDISQGGAKLAADFLVRGEELVLLADGLEPRRATVQWTRAGQAGIGFIGALPLESLCRWALERQQEAAAAAV